MSWGALAAPGWRMRLGLAMMLAAAGAGLGSGVITMMAGNLPLGLAVISISLIVAAYALAKVVAEAGAQHSYDRLCKEGIAAYTERVHLEQYNTWRHP